MKVEMLLTLKQPVHATYKPFHDYSPPTPPSTSRFSPALAATGLPLPTASTPGHAVSQLMSNPHRGLPPPAAMTLPPAQGPPPLGQPSALGQSLGQLPAPPQQWQGAEESMRNWLQAKSEEDKRKQEEEKTRQESLRLEQRKIEQDMLRTSLSGGIPPYMIPMVFAGMGGGNLPNASLEWAQHYMAQAHHLQQQQQVQQPPPPAMPVQAPPSPELRREPRQITHSYSSQPSGSAPVPSTPIGIPGPQNYLPSYPLSPTSRSRNLPGPSSGARQSQSAQLPRINTGEMAAQQPPSGPANIQIVPGQSAHPLSQSQSAQPSPHQPQSSPSIYFHHWQPPSSSASTSANAGNIPSTPSEPTYASPRKRKAQGPAQAAPPPSTQPQFAMSPSFSQAESSASAPTSSSRPRRGHSRQRSDMSSSRAEGYGKQRERLTEDRHSDAPSERMGGSRRRSNFDETRRTDAERERERDRAAKRDDVQD